jgi:GntR family transcriptional regulator
MRRQLAHTRVSEHLRSLLTEGQGNPHSRLPTEADLAAQFQVSRQTVRRAYAELVGEGLVERVAGKGSFPATGQRVLMSVQSVEDTVIPAQGREVQIVAPLTMVSNTSAATKLGLIDDVVGYVVYRHLFRRVCFGVTRVYLPPKVADALSEVEFIHKEGSFANEFVIGLLDRRLQQRIAIAKQVISAIAAPESIAALVQCPVNHPLLKIEFLYFDSDARPVQFNVNFYNSNLYEYRAQLRRRPDILQTSWAANFQGA